MVNDNRRRFLYIVSGLAISLCGRLRAEETHAKSTLKQKRYSISVGEGDEATNILQKAIDNYSNNDYEIFIPEGIYIINPVPGLVLRSNTTLRMAPGAVLKAKPTIMPRYSVLKVVNAVNVKIIGGAIIGERKLHLGRSGEWGMGIDIRDSHAVHIDGVHISECWGDGIYIGSATGGASGCSNITLRHVISERNRRQGLTISACNGATIDNCEFNYMAGTSPATGIDIEPNKGQVVEGVHITNCVAKGNQGNGFQMYAVEPGAKINNCLIDGGSSIENNRYGISIVGSTGTVVSKVLVENNLSYGIYVRGRARGTLISSNTIKGNASSSMPGLEHLFKSQGHNTNYNIRVDKDATGTKISSNLVGQ